MSGNILDIVVTSRVSSINMLVQAIVAYLLTISGVTIFGRNPSVSAAVRSVEVLPSHDQLVEQGTGSETAHTGSGPAHDENNDCKSDDDVDEFAHVLCSSRASADQRWSGVPNMERLTIK